MNDGSRQQARGNELLVAVALDDVMAQASQEVDTAHDVPDDFPSDVAGGIC